jgi:hypothetical protein
MAEKIYSAHASSLHFDGHLRQSMLSLQDTEVFDVLIILMEFKLKLPMK